MIEPSRAALNRAARIRAREQRETQAAAAAAHQCSGDRRGWCWECETRDAVAFAANRPRPAKPSRMDFNPFTILRDLEARR